MFAANSQDEAPAIKKQEDQESDDMDIVKRKRNKVVKDQDDSAEPKKESKPALSEKSEEDYDLF